jgi:hypothetical protein
MSREQSALVKGLAILLMLAYHFGDVLGTVKLPSEVGVFIGKTCHPIAFFMVVSGYGLYYAYRNNRLTYSYLLKRNLRLFISFWLVVLLFAVALGFWLKPELFPRSPYLVLTNFLGWRWDYNQYTWFLLPYVFVSLGSRVIFKCVDRLGNILSILVTCAISLLMTWLISRYYMTFLRYNYWAYHPVLVLQTLSNFTFGAVMARWVFAGHDLTWSRLKGKNLLVLALLVIVFVVKWLLPIPIVPYFAAVVILILLHFSPTKLIQHVFVPLGNKSMMMWFVHGYLAWKLFNDFYLMFKWPPLIWLVWVITSYLVACLLMPVSDYMSKVLKLK